MGTLFNQSPRQDSLEGYSFGIRNIAIKIVKESNVKITFEEALKCVELGIRIQSQDVKDEQLAGFGELLQEFNGYLDKGMSVLDEFMEKRFD